MNTKRRTNNCMKDGKSNSDLDHLVLLNNYLLSEHVNSPSSKKRKLTTDTRYFPNKIILKDATNEDSTHSLQSIQLNPDFCDEIEQRMKELSTRMDETLKKQEEYLEKRVSKRVIQKKESADWILAALCKLYLDSNE
ncbi:predicted protein [Naegleria gruberi]|uniref:Predicted protein n=1 Tax=Naegleria gruberi TaxID=5762 RepID=D2V5C6_NAEGR|nr:uncharacterized protein NAEGRDRAFT_63774 [Naegleria gruberi]EFC48086.1 predicted protein [Naegleria gruberi]|eukprot:XP_002680830.1 predicted protein [Naegleria gruberi strain NEG-M]